MKNKANLKQIVLMAAAGLGLFGATQAANAQNTSKNYEITGATNIFGYNGITYGLWPDKKITSENGENYYLKGNNWVSESGKTMPIEFNKELEKSASSIYEKSKENGSRIVGYFPFFHTPSKQTNTIVIYGDGTAALGNFFYDLDKQGAFYDENKNGKRDSKEKAMSNEFTNLYYEKLKELANKKGVSQKWIFPPLNEKERLAIALQAEDYEDFLSHDDIQYTKNGDLNNLESNQNDSKIIVEIDGVKKEIKKFNEEYNNQFEELDKKYDTKFKGLDNEISLLKIAQEQKTNFYDDSELKESIGKQAQEIDKYSKDIKKNSEVINENKNKIEANTSKISDLESKLAQGSITKEITTERVIEKEYIENNYDDEAIKQDISKIKDKLKVLEPLEGLASVVKQLEQEDAQQTSEKTTTQAQEQKETPTPQAQTQTSQTSSSTQYEGQPAYSVESFRDLYPQSQEKTTTQTPTEQNTKILPIKSVELEEKTKIDNKDNTNIKQIVREKGLYLIAGPEAKLDSQNEYDGAGANLGFRYEFSDVIGLGLIGSIDAHKDIIIDSYTEAPNSITGRYPQGITTAKNRTNFGGNLELRLGPFLFGIGGDYLSWIQESKEQIMKNDQELRSNVSSIGQNLSAIKYSLGVNIPLTENFGIEGVMGYNEKTGASLSLRGAIRLGNSTNKKIDEPKKVGSSIVPSDSKQNSQEETTNELNPKIKRRNQQEQ